eukprot:2146921-Rhodomonas_salina.2
MIEWLKCPRGCVMIEWLKCPRGSRVEGRGSGLRVEAAWGGLGSRLRYRGHAEAETEAALRNQIRETALKKRSLHSLFGFCAVMDLSRYGSVTMISGRTST